MTERMRDGRRASRRPAGSDAVLAACLLVVTLGALGHVAVHTKTIEVALDLGREQRAQTQLVTERRRLESELSRLRDPGRLEELARNKLQMAPPAPTDLRVIARPPVARDEGRR
jgi:cell division protein FtsL